MPKLNRRDFLKMGATPGAGAMLASCGPKAPSCDPASLPDLSTGETIPMEDLITAAKCDGAANIIAIPHDWANYGVAIEAFKAKYGLTMNENNPDAGSADELEAIRANKGNKGPEVPDTVDVGIGYGPKSMEEGLCSKYFLSTWGGEPRILDRIGPSGLWGGYVHGCRVAMYCDGAR